jgi:Protein kinase domain
MSTVVVPDDKTLRRLSLEELRQLERELAKACGSTFVTTEHGRVIDELESRPVLRDFYDEPGWDMRGRAVFVRHRRDDLTAALERVDHDLARDLEAVPAIPLRVARALVDVKQYEARWGDSDNPHAMIGDDVADSLDEIARFRDEVRRHKNELARHRRVAVDHACQLVRTPRFRSQSRARTRRKGVVRSRRAVRPAADPDPEASPFMFDAFETEVLAADGVWAVTFERYRAGVDWGDVAFVWIARATHDDERRHTCWLAISGVAAAVLNHNGFDDDTTFETLLSEYRHRFDRAVTEPGAKLVLGQDYFELTKRRSKPIDRIGREIERLCFVISGRLASLRSFRADRSPSMLLKLPAPSVYDLESVVLDDFDTSITAFYREYDIAEHTIRPDNVDRAELDLRRLLRRGMVAARRIFTPASPAITTAPSNAPSRQFVVPGYELVEQLGEGGYGVVYRARDGASIERAIKLLSPSGFVSQANTRERFVREAQALSRLDHRNLVKYLQLSEGPSGWYLIMELVRGAHLHRWSRDHSRLERAAAIASTLDGLAHMHEHGVIHRDLKPSNIMIESTSNRAVIVDFGLAWVVEDGGSDLHTRASTWSAAYAPPESIAAPEQSRSPLHDIYSMGVVLYEVLAGNRRGRVDGITLASLDPALAPLDHVISFATARADHRFKAAAEFGVALRAAIDEATEKDLP